MTDVPGTFASPADALRAAVDRVGSQAALARLLGLAQPSVWKWITEGKPLPAEHVLTVEAKTGVSRHDLRPDIYPRDSAAPAHDRGGLEPAR